MCWCLFYRLLSSFITYFTFIYTIHTKVYLCVCICVNSRASTGYIGREISSRMIQLFSIDDSMIVGHCFPIMYRTILIFWFRSSFLFFFSTSLSSSIHFLYLGFLIWLSTIVLMNKLNVWTRKRRTRWME